MNDQPHTAPSAGPILLCAGTDATVAARLAAAAAGLLADRPVVVVAIWDPPLVTGGYNAVMDALFDPHGDPRTAAGDEAAQAAQAAADVLDARRLDVSTRAIADERGVWPTILDIAEEIDASVIVAGADDGSARRPGALGQEVRALAHRTRRPLLVLRSDGHPPEPEAPALLAFDGSDPARHALDRAAALLRPRPALAACAWQSVAHRAAVAKLAVPDEVARKGAEAIDEGARRQAESHARDAAAQMSAQGWQCDVAAVKTARSVPGALVIAAEDQAAAVVVTGTRGRSRIAAALLGSTAESILRHAGRPVLLVPPAGDEG